MLNFFRFRNTGDVLGMNERNISCIYQNNPRKLIAVVDDKLETKRRLEKIGVPFPEVYAVFRNRYELRGLKDSLKNEFVIKPSRGSGGNGILVVKGKNERGWIGSNGTLTLDNIEMHCIKILEGLFSLDGFHCPAYIEYFIKSHPVFDQIAYGGVPDIRIVLYKGIPVMAMLRLPTRKSSGKANLHMGAVGVGIKISDGVTFNAIYKNKYIVFHPDTGCSLIGVNIPFWREILTTASMAYDAVKLGYLGVDIAIDKKYGPLVLELNARPGLTIQNANRCGLKRRLRVLRNLKAESTEERVELALKLDACGWRK